MTKKDFGSILTDYEFFMANSNEAEMGALRLSQVITSLKLKDFNLLDFGAGNGAFTKTLVDKLSYKPKNLNLVEPVINCLEASREIEFPVSKVIRNLELKPTPAHNKVDIIISNHVLYYVNDLQNTTAQISESLKKNGIILITMANSNNDLISFWEDSFNSIGMDIPYNLQHDVIKAFENLGYSVRKTEVQAKLTFPDIEQHRQKIARFLIGDYYSKINSSTIHSLFDRHSNNGQVLMNLTDTILAFERK
jgi:trans-aconitate 2-methyltransferase